MTEDTQCTDHRRPSVITTRPPSKLIWNKDEVPIGPVKHSELFSEHPNPSTGRRERFEGRAWMMYTDDGEETRVHAREMILMEEFDFGRSRDELSGPRTPGFLVVE